ncbi:two-component system regulatory protein YycI [Sedimentibacter hydroxybenzoicus DSM 7310]|uniref:Two-component system regulatory protein YycI n=1 Tax=Sedimentibacter hydroxybenzoicus DSM 7310 TaxID=1123245 RepID=A0A974GVD1_SEDHY|nr:two-component system regulatory protein YycI [Sedimentibacter hydroxybenzoicus]NYB73238.1 two-component system regulatory protein YycI [Sedimentibacter hydroxybenzoicus DSM 7310]
MDWNKSNIIFIVAFIILNIFLLSYSFNDIFSEEYNIMSDKDFIEDVENILKEKNIAINCEIPKEIYTLPVLDTEYRIINIDKKMLEKFLGEGIDPVENVFSYSNQKGESIEIIEGKKFIYTLREKVNGNLEDNLKITDEINNFLKNKNIDGSGFSENYRIIIDDSGFIMYTRYYNNVSVDNSYMKFYFDRNGIYKFEMQKIISIKEIGEKVNTFTAAESLLKLLSYDDVNNKEIIKIDMSYYSIEDENWQVISGINSYPVWKVIFSDGTQKHLISPNIYFY